MVNWLTSTTGKIPHSSRINHSLAEYIVQDISTGMRTAAQNSNYRLVVG
jgi:hypothetical protein